MELAIFFIVILVPCLVLDITYLVKVIRAGEIGSIFLGVIATLTVCLALWLNISDLVQQQHPTVETMDMSQVDTAMTQKGKPGDTTVIDLTPIQEQPVK